MKEPQKPLIVMMSGKKQSGKTSAGNHLACMFFNKKQNNDCLKINDEGEIIYSHNGILIPREELSELLRENGCSIYSFADPLKEFCVDVLGLDYCQCYGSDKEKNSFTKIKWDSLPVSVRWKYRKSPLLPRSGFMTAREVMQVVGSDIVRKMKGDAWARAIFNKIDKSGTSLAIVNDARFPNEIHHGIKRGAVVVRLLRRAFDDEHVSEKALDGYPLENYTHVIDNRNFSFEEQINLLTEIFESVLTNAKFNTTCD